MNLNERIEHNWTNGNKSDARLIIGSLSLEEMKSLIKFAYAHHSGFDGFFTFVIDNLQRPTK